MIINLILFLIAAVIPRTTGYVALDDLRILHGVCQSSRVCDFEDPSICGYQNDATAEFTWLRHSGATSSMQTGPSNGMYRTKNNIFFF